LSQVRMAYIQRENAELVTLTGCERAPRFCPVA
jgi:hypothetical protein